MASCTDKTERFFLSCERKVKLAASLPSAVATATIILTILASTTLSLAAEVKQQHFPSAEAAVTAMAAALKSDDTGALLAVFGPGSEGLVSSGDPVSDQAERTKFLERFNEKHQLMPEDNGETVLYVGNDEWPFPIPIVKADDGWHFDTKEGATEMLARRIGRNELNTIQVCLAFVEAQEEYASNDWNGDGVLAFAQKFGSDPGEKNGLFWPTGDGEEQSPLGPLVAEAQEAGYLATKSEARSNPYYGYYYRILKAQGEDAPGGAYEYTTEGVMTSGFALVAYPAQYGSSGIMTFITNHDGAVYQKDLGENTEADSRAMVLFNPDGTWEEVEVAEPDAE